MKNQQYSDISNYVTRHENATESMASEVIENIQMNIVGLGGEVFELTAERLSKKTDLDFLKSSVNEKDIAVDIEGLACDYHKLGENETLFIEQDILSGQLSNIEMQLSIDLQGNGVQDGLNDVDQEAAIRHDTAGTNTTDILDNGIVPMSSFVTITYAGGGHTHGSPPLSHNIATPGFGMLRPQGNMTRTSHSFLGWTTSVSPGNLFPPNVNIQFSGAGTIPFVAAWQLNQVTIRYNGNGHTGGTVPATQTTLTPATVITRTQGNMVRNGFVFTGWRLPDGRLLAAGGTLQFNATFGELVLTANWELPDLTMRFMGNGNTGGSAPSPIVFRTPGARNLPGRNTLTRADHTFVGWIDAFGYVSPPGTLIAEGATINASTPMHGHITFFAGWVLTSLLNTTISFPTENQLLVRADHIIRWQPSQGVTYRLSLYDTTFGGSENDGNFVRIINRENPTASGQFALSSNHIVEGRRYRIALHCSSFNAVEITTFRNFSVMNYNNMSRQALASEILARHNGTSSTGQRLYVRRNFFQMNMTNRLVAYANLEDTAAGLRALRSPVSNTGETIGGSVYLSVHLLRAILRINDRFGSITINTLTGGYHRTNSRHYEGRAVDFQADDWIVRGTEPPTRAGPIINYLRNTHGFVTQAPTGYIGNDRAFHLDILN